VLMRLHYLGLVALVDDEAVADEPEDELIPF
jgi:hypothetical protein